MTPTAALNIPLSLRLTLGGWCYFEFRKQTVMVVQSDGHSTLSNVTIRLHLNLIFLRPTFVQC